MPGVNLWQWFNIVRPGILALNFYIIHVYFWGLKHYWYKTSIYLMNLEAVWLIIQGYYVSTYIGMILQQIHSILGNLLEA